MRNGRRSRASASSGSNVANRRGPLESSSDSSSYYSESVESDSSGVSGVPLHGYVPEDNAEDGIRLSTGNSG